MFVSAIEEVAKFTRPVHTIARNYNETTITPGAATLFFVNDEGYALTCRHVMELIGNRQNINQHYQNFKADKESIGKNKFNQRIKELEVKYNYTSESIIQIKEVFIGVTPAASFQYSWTSHPVYDIALIKFQNFEPAYFPAYAKFVKDSSSLKQGKFLCRLGFPFPEFTNYQLNASADDIDWTNTGITETPRFPIEGMLTRHIMHDGKMAGIELSTPGLRGQSGGPLFDTNGIICGMQSGTNHLHLGFDMKNFELKTNRGSTKINNQPFLHVGHCVHVDVIKNFLRDNNVKFDEE